jgi:aerobic carbon-monoxide dehydrogenase small subunit
VCSSTPAACWPPTPPTPTSARSRARREEELTDVQQAFLDTGAVQCGFCIPGLITTVHDLLDRQPSADDLQVREAISGNLCRCTGYGRILEAVEEVKARREAAR